MRLVISLMCLASTGCVARAAWDVATLPVRATSQAVDWTTTSRDEADRNAGRRMRHERERQEKEARKEAKRQREADRPY